MKVCACAQVHSRGERAEASVRSPGDWHSPRRFDGEDHMSKSNDSSKLGHAKLENPVLADSELAAVTGGGKHPAKVTVPDIITKFKFEPISFEFG
jgi:hypothetical protein